MPSPFPPVGPQHGTVDTFDSHTCLGTIVDAAGRDWPFQCTALTDGTREVEPGTPVTFTVARRPGGRLEADRVGRYGSGVEAVRAGLEKVPADEERRMVESAIVAAYRKHPQTEADAQAATASLRAALEEESW